MTGTICALDWALMERGSRGPHQGSWQSPAGNDAARERRPLPDQDETPGGTRLALSRLRQVLVDADLYGDEQLAQRERDLSSMRVELERGQVRIAELAQQLADCQQERHADAAAFARQRAALEENLHVRLGDAVRAARVELEEQHATELRELRATADEATRQLAALRERLAGQEQRRKRDEQRYADHLARARAEALQAAVTVSELEALLAERKRRPRAPTASDSD